jgi:hypothetical protein
MSTVRVPDVEAAGSDRERLSGDDGDGDFERDVTTSSVIDVPAASGAVGTSSTHVTSRMARV